MDGCCVDHRKSESRNTLGLFITSWFATCRQDPVTHMVLVMLYIPTQIGREEKNNVSFIFVSFGPYLTLDVCEGFLLAKTEEQ